MSRSFTLVGLAVTSILALAPANSKADNNILATVGERAVTAREIEQA